MSSSYRTVVRNDDMLGQLIPVLLGAAFITVGTIMLTPAISPEVHQSLKTAVKELYDVSPIVEYKLLDIKFDVMLQIGGVLWIVCGAIILIGPYSLVRLAYLIMAVDLALGIYCHVKLDHKAKKLGPTAILLFVTLLQLFGGRGYDVKEHYE